MIPPFKWCSDWRSIFDRHSSSHTVISACQIATSRWYMMITLMIYDIFAPRPSPGPENDTHRQVPFAAWREEPVVTSCDHVVNYHKRFLRIPFLVFKVFTLNWTVCLFMICAIPACWWKWKNYTLSHFEVSIKPACYGNAVWSDNACRVGVIYCQSRKVNFKAANFSILLYTYVCDFVCNLSRCGREARIRSFKRRLRFARSCCDPKSLWNISFFFTKLCQTSTGSAAIRFHQYYVTESITRLCAVITPLTCCEVSNNEYTVCWRLRIVFLLLDFMRQS